MLEKNMLITVFLQFQAWQNAKRLKMHLKTFEHLVVKAAIKGTKFDNLSFFLDGSRQNEGQRFVFSPEINLQGLLQFEKKVPDAFLCGKSKL